MESKDAIHQALVEFTPIEAPRPEQIRTNIRPLDPSTVEAGVGADPAEAHQNELTVARREAHKVEIGRGAHTDAPISWVKGAVSRREL
jgi:hypothetical protein